MTEVENLSIIDEDAQMPTYAILLIDHAKANPWKTALEILEQLGEV